MSAPIALFAYRRPRHLARTIEALIANPESRDSHLYAFMDAAKDVAAEADVAAVREQMRRIRGFGEITLVERPSNFGLARNLTEGITEVLASHDDVVVIVVSPTFLAFMNDALRVYRHAPRVGSISGYSYRVRERLPETFFIRGADCWGWATWADRWRKYHPNGQQLLDELRRRDLTRQFDFDDTMGFTAMLESQIAGRNNSWAVRWHATCFLQDMLILYPAHSLVTNIGNDGSGTHSDNLIAGIGDKPWQYPIRVEPITVEESETGLRAFRESFAREKRRQERIALYARIRRRLRRLLPVA